MKNLIFAFLYGFPNLFYLQLAAAELLFSGSLHRREHFARKAWLYGLALLAVSVAIFYGGMVSSGWLTSNLLPFVLMFLFSLVFLRLCFEDRLYVLFLCAASGYMTQHIAAQLCQMLLPAPFSEVGSLVQSGSMALLWLTLSNLPVNAAVYFVIWYVFARHIRGAEATENVKKELVVLSAATLALVLVLSSIRDIYAAESHALMIITRIFSIACCLILLFLRTNIIERSEATHENALLRTMGELRERQYAESKETIELINQKAHDIRHQLGKMNLADDSELREVVSIYDSAVKTGNETLDTLLTEKCIFCERHQITLSCMIDGDCLQFMSVGDICAIFGNALENAIEAVMQIKEKEKRIISFRVRERMGMVAANIDNNYAGTVKLVDGMPRSSKNDDRYHGFGVKSIRRTAEKYGGEATVTVDDQFHLSILIPIP